jgi:hypothetical protein
MKPHLILKNSLLNSGKVIVKSGADPGKARGQLLVLSGF